MIYQFAGWFGLALAAVATTVTINGMQLNSAEKTAVDTYQLHQVRLLKNSANPCLTK